MDCPVLYAVPVPAKTLNEISAKSDLIYLVASSNPTLNSKAKIASGIQMNNLRFKWAETSGSDSSGQKLVTRDGVSGGYATQTEYLITKYASESELDKRNGNKLIALATNADFNPSEIRAECIRQIERWVALANDPNAIQNSIFCMHQMDVRNQHCI